MFLGILNQEEKENFLELAYYIAHCDLDFSSIEKNWIFRCRNEMNLLDYEVKNKNLDTIMKELSYSSFVSKTSILLEMMELMLADSIYHGSEQEVVKKLCENWNISNEQFENIVFWLKDKHIILKDKEKDI
jgi:uncharacterized tellurite resistance protein B-like protein